MAVFPKLNKRDVSFDYVCNVENCVRVLQKVCFTIQTEFKACNVLIVLQTWSKDQVYEWMVPLSGPQVSLLVSKAIKKKKKNTL